MNISSKVCFFQREIFYMKWKKFFLKGVFLKKNRKFKENLDFSVGILDFSGTEGAFASVLSVKC